MFGVEPLARIVRHDALKVVKVPAKGTREAYEYWRNFGGSDKALAKEGKYLESVGSKNIFKGFSSPKNVFTPLGKKERTKSGSISGGFKGFGGSKIPVIPQKNAYGLQLGGHISFRDLHGHSLGKIRKNASEIEDETGMSPEESKEAAQSLFAYSRSHRSIREAELSGSKIFAPPIERNGSPVDTVDAINSYLAAAPKFEGKIFRGMILPDQKALEDLVEGSRNGVTLNCLSSFSKNYAVASEFAYSKPTSWGSLPEPISGQEKSVMLVVSKNRSGVDISKYAQQKSEEEVLVAKGG